MKHINALVVKFVMVAVISELVLGVFTNLSIRQILLISLVITAATYLIADLLTLFLFNNTTAAVADAGMCWLIIYLANYVWPARTVPLLSALSAAVIIAIGEVFLHIYIEKNILQQTPKDRYASILR